MRSPVFSVVVPTHNRSKLLMRAVQSVVRQTFTDYELIIVDDGSTDATAEIVSAINDDRLVFLRNEQAGGATVARNAGIAQARGEIIAFLDDDDEYHPDFLAETYGTLRACPAEVGFSWCGVRKVRDTAAGEVLVKERIWAASDAQNAPGSTKYLESATSYGLAVRMKCFDVVGDFDESIVGGVEDTEFLMRLGQRFDFRIITRILVKIHSHTGPQLTDPSVERAKGFEQIVDKHWCFYEQDSGRWRRIHRRIAEIYFLSGDRRRGRIAAVKMVKRSPRSWKSWKSLIVLELFGNEQLGLRDRFWKLIPLHRSSNCAKLSNDRWRMRDCKDHPLPKSDMDW